MASARPPSPAEAEEALYRLPSYDPERARRVLWGAAAGLAADAAAALLAASSFLGARWRGLPPLGAPWLRFGAYPARLPLAAAALSTLALPALAAVRRRRRRCGGWVVWTALGLPALLALWAAALAPLYPPWAVLRWSARYAGVPALGADLRAAHALLATAGAALAAVTLAAAWSARRGLSEFGDTHGSSRWASPRDVAAAGLLAPPASPPPGGVVLGVWHDRRGRPRRLCDRGDRHVLAFAPTGSGKSTALVIPTLFEWTSSVVVLDVKGELWQRTAGYRRAVLGQLCVRFDPSARDGSAARYNPLLAIPRDQADVQHAQAVADVLIDPAGRDRPRTFWEQRAHALLVAAILHVLYARPEKTLAGCARLLSDPAQPIQRTLEIMLETRHDPALARGWHDQDAGGRLAPTPTHPAVAAAARALLDMDPRTASGVIATAQAHLDLFLDPILAANTADSDFDALDLVAGPRPVSLYVTVPPAEIERLRAPLRLVLNQLCRRLTGDPAAAAAGGSPPLATTARTPSKDGSGPPPPPPPGPGRPRRPLLLLLDEFTTLGRLDFFGRALAYLRGYGIRVFISIQALVQLLDLYGPYQSITANCALQVAFTPADLETAELLSRMTGLRTVHLWKRALHGGATALAPRRISLERAEVARPLLSADEVRRLPAGEALIFAAGQPPIRAARCPFYDDPVLAARAALPAPAASDRLARGAGGGGAAGGGGWTAGGNVWTAGGGGGGVHPAPGAPAWPAAGAGAASTAATDRPAAAAAGTAPLAPGAAAQAPPTPAELARRMRGRKGTG